MKIAGTEFGRKWLTSLVLGTIVGVVVFALIIAWVGLENVWEQRGSLNLTFIGVYLALTVLTYLLRALRFQLLLRVEGATLKLFGVVSVHTLMINLLPFSSGEISYPLLLKRYGISSGFAQGIPSILMARFQDALIYGSLMVAALVWTGYLGKAVQWVIGTFPPVTALAVLIAAVAAFLIYRKLGRGLAVVRRVNGLLAKVVSSFRGVSLRVWVASFVVAFSARFVTIVAVYFLFESIGIELPLSMIFLITSLYVFLPYLPINTPAGIGITEGYLMAFFIQGGIEQGAAAAASIQTHFLQLMVAAVLGVLGILLLQLIKRWENRRGRSMEIDNLNRL